MSHSKKRTKIIGTTTATSEKEDKKTCKLKTPAEGEVKD